MENVEIKAVHKQKTVKRKSSRTVMMFKLQTHIKVTSTDICSAFGCKIVCVRAVTVFGVFYYYVHL